MIKSQHSLSDLDTLALTFFKDIKAELGLSHALAIYPNNYLKPVMVYIQNNLKTIITGRPGVLEGEIASIQPLVDQAIVDFLATGPLIPLNKNGSPKDLVQTRTYALNHLRQKIREIFNYDLNNNSFVKKGTGKVAYRHAKRLNSSTCPYCNANFTFTIRNKRMKSRPQFDHFLNKDRYPYLALSFYNLIPSCALCNSGALKGTKPFSITTHLHPFIDDIEGLYEFKTNINAVDFLVNNSDFTLRIQPCKGVSAATRLRATNSLEAFGIQDRYNFHKDIAGEILTKAYAYNQIAIENLFKSFKIGTDHIFTSEAEIKELVMGNYLHPDRFHKRVLSKLTKDISEEFGLVI